MQSNFNKGNEILGVKKRNTRSHSMGIDEIITTAKIYNDSRGYINWFTEY